MPSATFPDAETSETTHLDANPFFAPSPLPYGLPPFGAISQEHFRPAFEAGLAEQLAEIHVLLSHDEAPTVENTLIPLERSGQLLARVSTVFFTLSAADSTPFIDTLEEELAPRLAAHADSIRLNPALFERIRTLFEARESEPDAETRYLIERYFAGYVASGAGLGDADKTTLRDLNARLSTLTTRFEKNVPAEANDLAVVFDDRIGARRVVGRGAVGHGRGSRDAGSRRQVPRDARAADRASVSRLPHRACLTATHHGRVQGAWGAGRRARQSPGGARDRTASGGTRARCSASTRTRRGSPPTRQQAPRRPCTPCSPRSRRRRPGTRGRNRPRSKRLAGHPIEASDWAFYTEQVRAAHYDIDTAAMRPYFEAERVLLDGVFFAATALYGITFRERADLDSYHPDARIFEVSERDGSPLGLYSLDLYTRDSKRGGAWMTSLVSQSALLGQSPVVTNNLNVPKPAAGRGDPPHPRRGDHTVPRVRSRAARTVRHGAIPAFRRNPGVPRLRGVPESGE